MAKSKNECQAHISKVSMEVDGPSQEICHYIVKDYFKSRKGTGKM